MVPDIKTQRFMQEVSEVLDTSKTMEDVYRLIISKNRNNIAVEYINSKEKIARYKYKKLDEHTKSIASILSNLLEDNDKGRVIVLKLPNNPHWGEVFWAILMSGYKPLLMDAKASKEGTQNIINQSKAIAIISDDMNTYSVKKIALGDLIVKKNKITIVPSWENEVIFCSSGTTGDVKLMVFNGENISHQINAAYDMPLETNDISYPKSKGKLKILAMIPFHHIFGFVAVFLWYSFYGKTLVFPQNNTPTEIQNICQRCGVTHVYSVPLFWDSLARTLVRKASLESEEKANLLKKMIAFNLNEISKEEAGISSSNVAKDKVQKSLLGTKVRFCISGGGYLSNETLRTINGIGYNLYNGYGMTEIGVTSVELSSDVDKRILGRIGKPMHSVEYKIDKKNKDDKTGELLVKSPTIHIREIVGGVENNVSLTSDGYFKTGDIAEEDNEGRYFIRGRIKDIIINADGENVFPDELEHFFNKLPHVNHLCVLGVSKENTKDEDIVLVLEVDNQTNDSDIENIRSEINLIIPTLPHKVSISEVYLSMTKLPLANNMKVKRFVIKKELESKSKDYVSINSNKKVASFEGFDENTINEIVVPMRGIFSKVLILPTFKIEDNAHWINDLGGDSMNYVELILKVQEAFSVTIPEEKYGQLTCINDFVLEVLNLKKNI